MGTSIGDNRVWSPVSRTKEDVDPVTPSVLVVLLKAHGRSRGMASKSSLSHKSWIALVVMVTTVVRAVVSSLLGNTCNRQVVMSQKVPIHIHHDRDTADSTEDKLWLKSTATRTCVVNPH